MSNKNFQFPDGSALTPEPNAASAKLTQEIISHRDFRVHSTTPNRHDTYWVSHVRGKRILAWPGVSIELEAVDIAESSGHVSSGKMKPLKLTMPGKVLAIKVQEGDLVEAGQGLVVVEAMKMENLLMASVQARITKIHVKEGDRLESGSLLISFESI